MLQISFCCRIARGCLGIFLSTGLVVVQKVDLSGLAVFENDGILGYALESCKKSVLAPVELYGNDGIGDYLDVLRRGFVLKWKALRTCCKCEESGGRCDLLRPLPISSDIAPIDLMPSVAFLVNPLSLSLSLSLSVKFSHFNSVL